MAFLAETSQQFLIWAAAVVVAFIVYRFIFGHKKESASNYERQINEILTSEKYKVKGRFE